ncbi:hypothetical protein VMCG_05588 [Cytospora schulzeri]|uniref:chitinase n=1 Tax=Cytospora schulzeri TaxID=448051 RepID=A0A423WEV2_9PEZI|nr:hypothetical protein VMCG_05588 [Valsa malicola]
MLRFRMPHCSSIHILSLAFRVATSPQELATQIRHVSTPPAAVQMVFVAIRPQNVVKAGNCTSNCDAKAECGQYGKPGQQDCPLSVCCSQFGFCGSTSDFCNADKGCQKDFGGCGDVDRPSCSGNSINKRTIGYYESWANTRKCQTVSPEDLNLNGYTQINFAFAFFDPSTFAIAPMDGPSGELLSRFTALKDNNNGLQTWISVGGWSFTDPGPTRTAFSDMASSSGNRKKFISELTTFMEHYGFDGVDLDWEYPQADDRGGKTADKDNYVSLVKELRAAFGDRYGISMTLPTSYWYLQHFDLEAIQPNVDWFNFMAYDLHGVWDAQSKFVGPYIAPHTNITEIDIGLDLLWRAGVKPEKLVLGLGWYGRSFTLSSPSCNTPNGICQFSGGADAGECSGASGILTLQEIQNIISKKDLEPVWDKEAGVKWITWDGNQWISYDDEDTFDQKRKFANSRCLGGTMIWAIDQADQGSDNGLAPAPGVTTGEQQDAKQMSDDLAAGITCYTTQCSEDCKSGTNQVSQMSGQPGKLSTNDRCKAGEYRNLCCDDGTRMDTNSHDKSGDRTCTGGIQSYCCKGFKAAPSGTDVLGAVEDGAKAAAEAAAEQAALDIAAKAFCRIAVPALLAPLELLEDLIPFVGWIADAAEIAATPALIQLCVKGIEKEGKAEFKVFGKEHSLSMDKPSKPATSRPPASSHSSVKTSTACPRSKRADCDDADAIHQTRITEIAEAPAVFSGAIECNGAAGYPQACLNYQSIQANYAAYHRVTCPFQKAVVIERQRTIISNFDDERKTALWDPLMPVPGGCSPDEYPPAVMADLNDGYDNVVRAAETTSFTRRVFHDRGQMVRYLPADENESAGRLLFKVCSKAPEWDTIDLSTSREVNRRARRDNVTIWSFYKKIFTRSAYTMAFAGLNGYADDGLDDNPCAPTQNGVRHSGYALLNEDVWFDKPANLDEKDYQPEYLKGPAGAARRSWVEPVGLVVVENNSSRVATTHEIRDEFGFDDCADDKCTREIGALKAIIKAEKVEAATLAASFSTVPQTDAVPTPAVAPVGHVDETAGSVTVNQPGSDFVQLEWPRQTGKSEAGSPV